MALAGILMGASCWWLRPYLGKGGAFIAAILLTFSPSLLYYTRFARHDGLMVLWEVWMVIGFFRYVDTGRPVYLYLLATATALAIGTHELYYILFFIFGMFVILRLLAELLPTRSIALVLAIGLLICVPFMVWNPPLPIGQGLYLGEKLLLVSTALLMGSFALWAWNPKPVLWPRIKHLVLHQTGTLLIALALLLTIYTVFYTTFFSYPRGILGMYDGLAYWLGSQHEFKRGDQPWYYYVMQLPIYEPLGIVSAIGACFFLTIRRFFARVEETVRMDVLFGVFALFWYVNAVVIFSWAGEKMPWLLVHMALPGNLLAAWVIGQLLRVIWPSRSVIPDPGSSLGESPGVSALEDSESDTNNTADDNGHRPEPTERKTPIWSMMLVPPLVLLLGIALGMALWRLFASSAGTDQAAQSNLLQGLPALIIFGALLYTILTIAHQIGARIVLTLTALTLMAVLGGYMVRATWLVVYDHPDTPIDPLIYVQTAPDVPLYVEDVRELSLNLTRSQRDETDVAGGLSLPILIGCGH